MTMRLNGWQRLWVVIAILYLLPVVVVMMLDWPTPERTRHRAEFVGRMPAELRTRVDGAYGSASEWEEALKRSVRPPDASRPLSGLERIDRYLALTPFNVTPTPKPLLPGVTLFSEPVSFPNGAVLEIQVAKNGDTQHDARAAAAYWAVVTSASRAEQWRRAWQMALVWLIPCLALYALGWATAWVRRGFSGRDSAR